MYRYTADNLAIMSTILACATRTQCWTTVGTRGTAATQEEVQMLRVGQQLFIACNGNGHTAISEFMTAFGVRDEASFIESLRWTHAVLTLSPTQLTRLQRDEARRSRYSEQEMNTINAFRFPSKIAKTVTTGDAKTIFDCAARPEHEPETPTDWKAGRFRHLLGSYRRPTEGPYASPPNAAVVTTRTYAQAHNDAAIVLVADTTAQVHAELKLLSRLAKMVVEGRVAVTEVQLGGLKNACTRCDAWIRTFRSWLQDRKGIRLKVPHNDHRPHAGPANWANPAAVDEVINERSAAMLLAGRFA